MKSKKVSAVCREKKKTSALDSDTIAAIITPPGEGGIGAIRISGSKSLKIIDKIFKPSSSESEQIRPFHLYYGHIVDDAEKIIDEVTMVTMPAGKSYTGQEQAEIFCHGGQFVLKQVLTEIFRHGARPAEPGEFTRRAFLAGRIDLAKAEAVADIIAAKTEYSYRAARDNLMGELSQHIDNIKDKAIVLLAEIEASIDYPEENLETAEKEKQFELVAYIINELKSLLDSYRAGKIIKEGFKIAIAGQANSGKSSLFNLLLNQSRAIVTPVPGTTRDYLTEWIDLEGIAVSLTDTAGLRKSTSSVEKAGQIYTEKVMKNADLVIWMIDISKKQWKSSLKRDIIKLKKLGRILIVLNKIDLIDDFDKERFSTSVPNNYPSLPLSCLTKSCFKALRRRLIRIINEGMPDLTDRLVVTSERHKKKLAGAYKYFMTARRGIENEISPELIALEIRQGINQIDEITGKVYTEEILDRIFSQFCIGK